MKLRKLNFSLLAAALLMSAVCFTSAEAQTRNRRRAKAKPKPVVTNPDIAPPNEEQDPNEPKVVSTADETDQEATTPATKSTSRKKPATTEKAEMQDTINSLSNQVERLNDKLTQMQDNDKTLLDMERLTRAEQRAENLRSQLIDVEGRLADFQSKLEQIEYALKPENIERVTQGYGTTRPEEARDARRKQLEGEKNRTLAQIRILETSKQRLEASLVTADAEVDRLRRKMELQEQQETLKNEAGAKQNGKP
jgi:hypothetical protein